MSMEKLAAFAVICAVLLVLLRHSRPEQAVIFSILAAVLLMFWLLDDVLPLMEELRQLAELFHFGEQRWQILMKTMGICFLTQTAEDVCRDAGESSLGAKIELAGKAAILLLCLPLFRELLSIAVELIG